MSTRSLGRLTLDLVARTGGFTGPIDKASRQTRRQMQDMSKQIRVAAAAVTALGAAAATAAAAGLVHMTRAGMQSIDSQAKLARSLEGTIDGVRALNIAASDSGIDGMEASLNRMNRRLGAIDINGGPAVRTVERLNLNLAELRRMDVDERLAHIADRIRESGMSSQEAARHLQQLGFEQVGVTELFMEGGDAIRAARQEVDDFGLSVSMVDAAVIEAAGDQLARVGRLGESLRNSLAVELAPVVLEVATRFNEAAREAGGMGNVVETSMARAVVFVGNVADAFDITNRRIHVAGVTTRVFALEVAKWMYEASAAIMSGPVAGINSMIDAMNKVPGVNIEYVSNPDSFYQAQDLIDELTQAVADARADIEATLSAPRPSEWLEDLFEAAKRRREEMIQHAKTNPYVPQTDFDTLDDLEKKAKEAAKAYEQWSSSLRSLEDRLFPMEARYAQFIDDQAMLNEALARGVIDTDRHAEAIERLGREMQNTGEIWDEYGLFSGDADDRKLGYWDRWLEGAENAFTDFDRMSADVAENFSRGMGNALEGVIFDFQSLGNAGRGIMEGVARSTVNALGQMAAQWATYHAVQLALGRSTEAAAIAGAAATGASMAAAYAPAAAAASLASFGANAAPAMAGITSTHALSQSMSLVGMAHDGWDSLPETGSYYLQKGERVTTAQTSAKLDATLERIQRDQQRGGDTGVEVHIHNAPKGTRTETRWQDGKRIIDVVVGDIVSDGSISQALGSTYALRRVGR